jgi:hypothetical protein
MLRLETLKYSDEIRNYALVHTMTRALKIEIK